MARFAAAARAMQAHAARMQLANDDFLAAMEVLLADISAQEKAGNQALGDQLAASINDREQALRYIERTRCINVIRIIREEYSDCEQVLRALTKAIDAIRTESN